MTTDAYLKDSLDSRFPSTANRVYHRLLPTFRSVTRQFVAFLAVRFRQVERLRMERFQASDLLVGRPMGREKPDQADPLESTEPSSASSAAVWVAGVDRARSGRRLTHARGEPHSREVQRQIPLHTRRANCGGPVEVVSMAPCPQPTQTGGGTDAIRSALSTGRLRPSSCARSIHGSRRWRTLDPHPLSARQGAWTVTERRVSASLGRASLSNSAW
jgi:hypothetical protein